MGPPRAESMLYFNGLNASTGEYLDPPMTLREVARHALQGQPRQDTEEVRGLDEKLAQGFATFAVRFGLDECDLSQTGWAAIFPHDADPAVGEALKPLLDLRREQAGDQYREYAGASGYHLGETWEAFRERHGISPGFAIPAEMPYYVLLVSDPEAIPFGFQRQLGIQRAAGRLHFGTLDEYASYARGVVVAERARRHPQRRIAFFSPVHPADPSSLGMRSGLVEPLAEALSREMAGQWQVVMTPPEGCTKPRLHELLCGPDAPSILFAATHGVGFNPDDARAASHFGALVCGEWPGPQTWQVALRDDDHYFSVDDVAARHGTTSPCDLSGMIAIFVSSNSAGAVHPRDAVCLPGREGPSRGGATERAFVAPLARRLLGNPDGGALAVVGYADRVLHSASILEGKHAGAGRDVAATKGLVKALALGYPLGYAMEAMNRRYAEIAGDIWAELQPVRERGRILGEDLSIMAASLWTAWNDARRFVVIGDPAVRLPAASARSMPSDAVVLAPPLRAVPPPSLVEGSPQPALPAPAPAEVPSTACATVVTPASATGTPALATVAAIAAERPAAGFGAEGAISLRLKPTRVGVERRRELLNRDVIDSEEAFRTTLHSLMRAQRAALAFHWGVFLLSLGLFAVGGWLWAVRGLPLWGLGAALAGAVGVLVNLASWPARELSQDIQFVTWLGLIYNTYWARLATAKTGEPSEVVLQDATRQAELQLQTLILRYASVTALRLGLFEQVFGRRRKR